METIIGLASVVILVLEGFDLFRNSDREALIIAITLGVGYGVLKLFKVVGKKLDCYPSETKQKTSDIKTELPKPEPSKTTVPYKNYASSYEADEEHLGWNVFYHSNKINRLGILATRDVKRPSDISGLGEGTRRKIENIIDSSGGYCEKNAFACICYAYDENDADVNIPDKYKYVYIRNGTVDVVANKLLNDINQYIGTTPWFVSR